MKRLPLLLIFFAIFLSLASCKSESKPDAAANSGPNPQAPGGAATPEATPPPGAEEISEARFQNESRQNPDDPTPHYNLGNIYLAEGKYMEAAAEFKFVADKNPKDVDTLGKMGVAYASANKFDEAIEAFTLAVKLAPANAELRQRLADADEKAGKTAEAAKERAAFQRLQPNEHAKELYKAGKYEEAVTELQKISGKNAETYFLMGLALLKLNQLKEAASVLRQAVRLNPKYADAFFQLGNVYDRLNQQEDAAQAFQQATRLNPQDADALFNLGNTDGKLKRFKEAADAFARAVLLKPDDAEARFNLGVMRLKSGDVNGATEQYNALKAINPETANKLQQLISQGQATK
jgi:Flp pilus assembly protein TadD